MRGCARRDIHDRYPDARWFIRPACDRTQPAFGLDQQVIGLARGHVTIRIKPRDRTGDQTRVFTAQILKRKPQAFQRPMA